MIYNTIVWYEVGSVCVRKGGGAVYRVLLFFTNFLKVIVHFLI